MLSAWIISAYFQYSVQWWIVDKKKFTNLRQYLLIWQKYLSTWTSVKYVGHQVQVPSTFEFQKASMYKYQVLNNLHQVPSTSTLLDPNPGNFQVMFHPSKASRAVEEREGMAHWCWPQFMMAHETCTTKFQIRKDGIIQTSPVVAINRLKDPPTWLKVTGGHHLRKADLPSFENCLVYFSPRRDACAAPRY